MSASAPVASPVPEPRRPPWGRRAAGRRGGLPAALLLSGLAAGGGAVAAPAPSCAWTVVDTAAVGRVVDGRTFVLADGREVRLAAIVVPLVRDGDTAAEAAAALRRAIGENEIVLKRLGDDPARSADRHGRLLAHGFVGTAAGERSLAHVLLAQGQALLSWRAGEKACLRDLAVAEQSARSAKLGLWGDPRYELRRAENPAEVLAVRGRYALVEGKVLSVRESGGTIYVNFGRRWTEDFTVTILKRNERLFVAAGLAPQRLPGRRVVIRGVVEERGGPWIEATRPEQIELIDGH